MKSRNLFNAERRLIEFEISLGVLDDAKREAKLLEFYQNHSRVELKLVYQGAIQQRAPEGILNLLRQSIEQKHPRKTGHLKLVDDLG